MKSQFLKKAVSLLTLLVIAHHSYAASEWRKSNSLNLFISDTAQVEQQNMQQLLAEIMNTIGLHQTIEIKAASVKNIEAAISHKKRYILYNPTFINALSKVSKDKWMLIALIAHETGHHLNGHTIKKTGSTPELELEADEFAGFVLYKMGATVEQAQEVMNYIAKPQISATHPARSSRMLAIQTGWNKAANPSVTILAKNPTATAKEIKN